MLGHSVYISVSGTNPIMIQVRCFFLKYLGVVGVVTMYLYTTFYADLFFECW